MSVSNIVGSLLNHVRDERNVRLEYFRACTSMEEVNKNQGALDTLDQLEIVIKGKWSKYVKETYDGDDETES